jgi:[NiFe] hydrogenase assembly HybE family chaperone
MPCPATVAKRVEKHFTHVHRSRMADMPLVNRKLRVQAVGFRQWGEGVLGVLVTPWSMNLILMVDKDQSALLPAAGSKIRHRFPSGPHEFIVGGEPGFGPYQMCSMFSPMFEFENQASAVATAKAVMKALMDGTYSQADVAPDPAPADDPAAGRPGLRARLSQPMSRRDLLRGAFLRNSG